MSEDNRKEVVFSDSLLEEIAVTLRYTRKYIRSILAFFAFGFVAVVVLLILLLAVNNIAWKIWAVLGTCFAIPLFAMVIATIVFLIQAGIKSHELLASCKRQLKNVSTIREMELIRIVTDLRNLFILNGAGFFTAFMIWLITIFMVNKRRKELQLNYLKDYQPISDGK